MNKILHQSIPASPIKSLGRAPGLANAWPLGSTRFANAPPAGLTMRANANGVGGGGTWVQLELTDALIYNKASVITHLEDWSLLFTLLRISQDS